MIKKSIKLIGEMFVEMLAGAVADHVERIQANRAAAHVHRPARVLGGTKGESSYETDAVVPMIQERVKRNDNIGEFRYLTGIRLCAACGQLYYDHGGETK